MPASYGITDPSESDRPCRAEYNLWDSKGLEPGAREATFLQSVKALVGLEAGAGEATFLQSMKALVSRLQGDPDPRNHIHLVWYTIQGPGARVTATDHELIEKVFPNVIVVITKNDITKPIQRESIIAELVSKGVRDYSERNARN